MVGVTLSEGFLVGSKVFVKIKYARPCYSRTEMYACRVACCPLLSHVEYASRALSRFRQKTGQMDGRTPGSYITLPLDADSVKTQTLIYLLRGVD